MARVRFEGVSHVYPGTTVPAVGGLNLQVEHGEFLALLGPSGAGKSTILRLLSGLAQPSTGRILIDEVDVAGLPSSDRDIAIIGSNHPLYPHLTVAANLGFALSVAGVPNAEVSARVEDVARALGVTALLLKSPRQLTPGQRHTVTVGRAMVGAPGVLVLDEPLSGLDAAERRHARTELTLVQHTWVTTTIYVTQNQTEAMILSDRVAVLDRGALQQVAAPLEVYHRPATIAVAQFFGIPAMNTLRARLTAEGARIGGLVVPVPLSVREALPGDDVVIGVRSEDLHVLGSGAVVRVRSVDNTGIDAFIHGFLEGDNERQQLIVRTPGRSAPRIGELVCIEVFSDEHVLFFHPLTSRRIWPE